MIEKPRIGQRVFWHDPDNGVCSGPGTITSMQHDQPDDDTIISLDMDDGGEAECLRSEIDAI